MSQLLQLMTPQLILWLIVGYFCVFWVFPGMCFFVAYIGQKGLAKLLLMILFFHVGIAVMIGYLVVMQQLVMQSISAAQQAAVP